MERPFTFGPSLFKAVDGTKISFHLRRCDNESEIREYIENGGGAVVDEFVSQRNPFTITLEDAMNSSAPPKGRDTFRPEFIIKCCARNKLVPLKPFSNNASKFSNEFDPNDVLLHKISWSEASKFCLEETNAHAKKYQITKATGPRQKAMLECLLKQDRKRNRAREQEEMAELKSRHERHENASEGMIQETCEDLESMPDASNATQDLFSMVDSPIHERSDVNLSLEINSENSSPVAFEFVDETETESEGEVGSSSDAFDQVKIVNSPWSPDGLRWTGCTQVKPKVVDMSVQASVKVDVGVQTSPVKISYPTPHQ